MPFDDNDLKRLKLFIDSDDNGNAIVAGDFIVEAKLKSLIARLEAAEFVITDAQRPENFGVQNPLAVEAWEETRGNNG